jgi:hypothetical protein
MARIEKTVFISYRRTDESWALAVFENLTQHGYDVFIDYDGIASGNFATVILENIRARAHFLVLLTPTALERCCDPKDWMRREIEAALDSQRNIVPLMLAGFDFGTPATASQLTGKLAALKEYNGLEIPKGYFPPAMERLRNKFLSVSLDTVLHPASRSALQAATEQKDKATMALGDALHQPWLSPAERRKQAAAWLIAPGRWRMVAGSAIALLLLGWIGLYQMGVPVWVPWMPRAEQPDPLSFGVGSSEVGSSERQPKAAADAEAKRKAEEAEQERLKQEVQRQAKAAADAEKARQVAQANARQTAAAAPGLKGKWVIVPGSYVVNITDTPLGAYESTFPVLGPISIVPSNTQGSNVRIEGGGGVLCFYTVQTLNPDETTWELRAGHSQCPHAYVMHRP